MQTMSSQNAPVTPQSPQEAPKKSRKYTTIIVISVLVVLVILGVIVRAVRNRAGVQGILQRNNSTNTATTNTVANSTNATTNTTTNNTATNSAPTNNTETPPSQTPNKNKFPAGRSSLSFEFGGVTRTAIVYVPKNYSSASAMPLIVNLHGSESTAEGQENNSHMDQTAESNGFIVAYPNGINEQWNDSRSYTRERTSNADDVGFITKLVSTISDGMNIDSHRVYAAGMSNGGMMSHRLACDKTSLFAAIADVAGAIPTELKNNCRPSGTIPVMIIHGTTDPIVPFNGGDLNSGRGNVLSTRDAVKFWAKNNGVSTEASSTTNLANTSADGTTITKEMYGNSVVLYQVNNGGHTWPGGLQYARPAIIGIASRDMDASQVIWDFFKSHTR